MCVGNFKPLMPINRICQTKSESDFFVYQKSLKRTLKPVFELVWNVQIKFSGIQKTLRNLTGTQKFKRIFGVQKFEKKIRFGDELKITSPPTHWTNL